MLIFRGWASIVGLFAAALLGAGLQSMTGSRVVAYVIAGGLLAAFGWFINAGLERGHALFWIPIQYWGLLIAVGAVLGG